MPCTDADDGTATASAIGGGDGINPLIYAWTTLDGVILPGQSNDMNLTGLEEGTYTCLITSNIACPTHGPFSITITNPVLLSATSIIKEVACFEDTTGEIDIDVTGGGGAPYTYNWVATLGGDFLSSGNVASDDDLTGLTAGTYTCTVTDNRGCVLDPNHIAVVKEPSEALAATLVSTAVQCNPDQTGAIDLTPTGGTIGAGYTYAWVAIGGTPLPGVVPVSQASNEDLTLVVGGDYEVTVTDSAGCILVDTATILQPALPLAATSVIVDLTCHDDGTGEIDIDVTGGGGAPYTYNWVATLGGDFLSSGNAASDDDLTGLTAGTYTCTVTDNAFCVTVHTAIVANRPILDVADTSHNNMSCFGIADGDATVNPIGGTQFTVGDPYTYEWFEVSGGGSTGQLTQITTATLSAQDYFCRVTDSLGCSEDTEPMTITNPDLITLLSDTFANIACFDDNNGLFTVTPVGGTEPYTYLWSDDNFVTILGYTDSTSLNTLSSPYLFGRDW